MKRVLVTGATGFCGKYLCEALISKGYSVTGTYQKVPPEFTPSHPAVRIDLKSRTAVQKLVRKVQPHALFHLAAQSSARQSWQLPEETFEVNAGATLNLLHALRESSPKTRFVFASSVQVYGKVFLQGRPVDETSSVCPENPYAASKRVAELACLDFYHRFGLDVVIARMVNHTGPGQDSHYVLSDWCRQIAMAEKNHCPGRLEVGNLKVERDFLHVQDVIRAYQALLSKGKAGEIYNVASGRPVPLQHYAAFLSRHAKVNFKIIPVKSRMRKGEPQKTRIRSVKLRGLGWKPQWTVDRALRELLEDWRKRVAGE